MPKKAATRNRSKPDILGFEPGFNFPASWARYDKIELSIDMGGVDTTNSKTIHDAFRTLAKTSTLLRNEGSEDVPALAIKKRKSDWLLGGQIRVYPKKTGRSRLRAHLSLNVSRYFAHNPPSRRPVKGNRTYKLQSYGPSLVATGMEALDGRDNLVIEARLAEARDINWNTLFKEMLYQATNKIAADIEEHSPGRLFYFSESGAEDWTIKAAEVYWEFQVPNAPLVAESFSQHAADHFRRHRLRMHLSEIDTDGAAQSYIFDTKRKDVSIALYAKTDNRIRVECRFKTYPKQIYSTELTNAKYPASRVNGLLSMLSALTAKASKEMKPLREAHESFTPTAVRKKADAIGTLAALSWVAGHDQIMTRRILQSLMLTGRVSAGADKTYNAVLDKMAQRGLVRPYPKRARQPIEYAPVASFKRIIAAL